MTAYLCWCRFGQAYVCSGTTGCSCYLGRSGILGLIRLMAGTRGAW